MEISILVARNCTGAEQSLYGVRRFKGGTFAALSLFSRVTGVLFLLSLASAIGSAPIQEGDVPFISDPREEREILNKMEQDLGISSLRRTEERETQSEETAEAPLTVPVFRVTISLGNRPITGELVAPTSFLEVWSSAELVQEPDHLLPYAGVQRIEFTDSPGTNTSEGVACRVVGAKGVIEGFCKRSHWSAFSIKTEAGLFRQIQNTCLLDGCDNEEAAGLIEFMWTKEEALKSN